MTGRYRALAVLLAVGLLVGCSSGRGTWVDEEVTFDADGLTVHGTYRHDGGTGPGALLISESGRTDRNGDNNVAGPIGNMRQLAEYLSEHGSASLRYDKVGTGQTGLGRYADKTAEVGAVAYAEEAKAAVRYLAGRSGTQADRISVYALGYGGYHAMQLAGDTSEDAPRVHSLALLQPLPARYLDQISGRVEADVAAAVRSGAKTKQQGEATLAAWRGAVAQIRRAGTVPEKLPDGLGAIVNPGNVIAVAQADALDPLKLAAAIPAGTPVLLTCSDTDAQAKCSSMKPLAAALAHTALQFVELSGVNHVLRDDPTDNIANYARQGPLSPQLTAALDQFVTK